ncbi:two-component sensor histidine kinase [Longispora fulva]|nr:two-component sensor histidine kinase [Longispora fulva]
MRRWGVRARSAVAAVIVVAVVLAVAAGAFVFLHRRALISVADASAVTRAEAVAGILASGDSDGLGRSLRSRAGEQTLVQVVGTDGAVRAASAEVAGQPALSPLRPAVGTIMREDRTLAVANGATFRIVAVCVNTPGGAETVLVAQSLYPIHEAVESEVTLLAAGYPILLLLVGAATAVFVGRSLRPVEAVRRQVALITDRHLHARVPVPGPRDEIRHLAETMNAMLDRLEVASRAQRRFVADASHELRSPLSTITLGLELLDTPPPGGVDPGTVALLRGEAARLESLVADLLLLARADERGLSPRWADVDLDDLMDSERTRLRALPGLTVNARIDPVRVRGDRDQIARAIRNITDNAARHARHAVGLRLWRVGADARIEVTDDGPGIAVADRDRVFGRFVRLEDSRQRVSGGTGLGLAIVAEIVAGHGGTVSVGEAEGGGTAVVMSLPVVGEPVAGAAYGLDDRRS